MRIVYVLCVLAICAVLPVFVNTVIGYAPLFIVIVLIVVSFIYLRLVARAFTFAQTADHYEWIRGEQGCVTVSLTNASHLMALRLEPVFAVSDEEGGDMRSVRMRTSLAAHETRDLGMDVTFDHVGLYRVGLCQAEIFDLLGLFSTLKTYDRSCVVRVVPAVYDVERIIIDDNESTDVTRASRSVLADDVDYAFVREYELGDPMKKVHWKISARNRTLYTKLFESHSNPGIAVFLDFYTADEDRETVHDMYDTMLEGCFSLLDFAHKHGIETCLVFRDRTGDIRTTSKNALEDLDQMIDDMPQLSSSAGEHSAADMIDTEAAKPDMLSNVFYFGTTFTSATIESLADLTRAKRRVRVCAVLPSGLSDHDRAERLSPLRALAPMQITSTFLESGSDIAMAGAL